MSKLDSILSSHSVIIPVSELRNLLKNCDSNSKKSASSKKTKSTKSNGKKKVQLVKANLVGPLLPGQKRAKKKVKQSNFVGPLQQGETRAKAKKGKNKKKKAKLTGPLREDGTF